MMNTYITTDFTGHYPVGVSAVVNAPTPEEAAFLLNAELRLRGLDGDAKPENMKLWDTSEGDVLVLQDGDY